MTPGEKCLSFLESAHLAHPGNWLRNRNASNSRLTHLREHVCYFLAVGLHHFDGEVTLCGGTMVRWWNKVPEPMPLHDVRATQGPGDSVEPLEYAGRLMIKSSGSASGYHHMVSSGCQALVHIGFE